MYKPVLQGLLFSLMVASVSGLTLAQSFVLDLPLRSQYAEVTQRIGVTNITIKYSRPLVNNRKIWDGLVPYRKVWRTGANTNTTIAFSDPVMIEGKLLDKGTYGLHTIPNADEWTIIFSKNSTSWGSFTYDQAEDALRVNVKPKPVDMNNALIFEFDELQPDSTVVKLKWEKIEVPFKVTVDVHERTRESLKKQLRTLSRYTWISWDDAANYLLAEKIDLNDALTYAEKSIENEDRFENEITKSKVLMALNRQSEADTAQKRALDLGTPRQVHQFARELMAAKRNDEAFAIFRENARKHPDLAAIQELLADGLSPNMTTEQLRGVPFFQDVAVINFAAMSGNGEVVRTLLHAGTDVRNGAGAVSDVLVLYLSAGVYSPQPDRNLTGSLKALRQQYEAGVRELIEAGADLKAKDDYGRTTLMLAAQKGLLNIMTLLIDKGVSLNTIDRGGGTALDYAITNFDTEGDKVKTIKFLLSAGADPNLVTKDHGICRASLITSVQQNSTNVITSLVAGGAKVNLTCENGETALTNAVRLGYYDSAVALIRAGADVKGAQGSKALAHARECLMSHPSKCKVLVDLLASAGARDAPDPR